MASSESNDLQELTKGIADYAAQDFVQTALRQPSKPTSILSFLFGVDFCVPDEAAVRMRSGQPVLDMSKFWFAGCKSTFDDLCEPFGAVAEAVEAGILDGPEWARSVDTLMAQLLLFDQVPRHIFRGSQRAFAYDSQAQKVLSVLCDNLLKTERSAQDPLMGELYCAYLVFILAALTHSERLEDHERLIPVLDHADRFSPPILHEWFEMARGGAKAHTEIVRRFGRYPHRNVALNRTNTPEEAAWLADYDNLPSWAKSQMVR